MIEKVIKNNIRELRKQRELTQQQLADKIGISQVHLGRLETNARSMDLEQVEKISAALGVNPYELLPQEWRPEISTTAFLNTKLLAKILLNIKDWQIMQRKSLTPEDEAEVVAYIYKKIQNKPAENQSDEQISNIIEIFHDLKKANEQ